MKKHKPPIKNILVEHMRCSACCTIKKGFENCYLIQFIIKISPYNKFNFNKFYCKSDDADRIKLILDSNHKKAEEFNSICAEIYSFRF